MVDMPIDAVPNVGRGAMAGRETLAAASRHLRRVIVRIRAEGELSCIDQRLRDDAGLTPERYLNAAQREC